MEESRFYSLPKVPYEYSALVPHISEEQLKLHHQKHHQAYVNGANAIFEKLDKARKGNQQVKSCGKKHRNALKKIEQEHEIYGGATDVQTYWIIHARIPKSQEEGLHDLHFGKKYISGPNQEGDVLILPDPRISDAYKVESLGKMETFDDFVKKALAQILSDKEAADKGQEEGCGTSCG